MKIYGLIISRKIQGSAIILCSDVREFMDFTAEIVAKGTPAGTRTSIREKEYMCHGYIREDGLSAVAICDLEYPQRHAFTMLNKLLGIFSEKHSKEVWTSAKDRSSTPFPELQELLIKYQNPTEADLISKVQLELDETKLIMCDTIEKVLNRGEKLDDLVAKSEGLSQQSKLFYRSARKTNACCGGL